MSEAGINKPHKQGSILKQSFYITPLPPLFFSFTCSIED